MVLKIRIHIVAVFVIHIGVLTAQNNQTNNNTTGTIVGTNTGTINVNNYSGTAKSAVSESYNSNYSDPECLNKRCGDVCFLNKTDKQIAISFNGVYITINAGEASCVYQVPIGPQQYRANIDPNNRIMDPRNPSGSDKMREAQVFVEQCKSKTIVIH